MFRVGQQIGIYTLIRKLGEGGFGQVWLAEKTSEGFRTFKKNVAVKLPHTEQVNFEAIEQEALLWEQVSGHSNVLPIIDADIFDGQVVIVSEFAEGGSLADRLKAQGKLEVRQAAELTVGILHGLEFLHSKRILHRDIKPANILLQGNTPRLADFGISRAMNTTTFSSKLVGTDAYMSPEALDGKRSVQTDIWSVGVVLYEMLKGELPFPQEHPSERMFAILMKEYEPLSFDIPAKLRAVVQKALVKQPENRYASAEEMREDLVRFLVEMSMQSNLPTQQIKLPPTEIYGAPTKKFEQPETIQPKRLMEIGKVSEEVDKTQAAVTASSMPTEQINPNSGKIRPLYPTEPVRQLNTAPTAKPQKSNFIIYGFVGLVLMFFAVSALGILFYTSSNAKKNIANSNLNQETVTNNKVLDRDKIKINKNFKGWVSSDNKMRIEFEITGIGETELIEKIRKDGYLGVEINDKDATVTETSIINGVVLLVRAETLLTTEKIKTFSSNKSQDFYMLVEIKNNDDVVLTDVATKFRKGNGSESLGDVITFGDYLDADVVPMKTQTPVTSVQKTPVRKISPPKTEVVNDNTDSSTPYPKKQNDKKGTTIDGYPDYPRPKTVATPQKNTKMGKSIDN